MNLWEKLDSPGATLSVTGTEARPPDESWQLTASEPRLAGKVTSACDLDGRISILGTDVNPQKPEAQVSWYCQAFHRLGWC
jgi:hypothetical protein